ncbi:MAG: hypothetical protein ABIN91_21475 [Mucilaginibacter sp.]|uniref:hypothetical protein n=1 Tax=Mucilaginibacter sp. TaxID=1882438 RepID=UPI003267FB1C
MNTLISKLKIMMKVCCCMLCFTLIAIGITNAQQMPNDKNREEKIRSLISQMTLQEKVG